MYELMILAKGSQGEEKAKEISKNVKSEIEKINGSVLESDFWGLRKLAYPIKKETQGYYEVILLELPKENLEELKTKFNLMDDLVRYLITAKDADSPTPGRQVEVN